MSFTRRTYEEIRESILDQITKGVVKEKHLYTGNRRRYALEYKPVKEIVSVEGLKDGASSVFSDSDYTLRDGRLEWLPGKNHPDEQSEFHISYSLGLPISVTDVTPGSVVRTIVEAVSREIDFMYAQMDQVYFAGFIDTAEGSALDLVVSILGVDRKPAEPATGTVTFGRNTDPSEVNVESEAQIHDGRISYSLKNSPVKGIKEVEGTLNGDAYTFEIETDLRLSEDKLEWIPTGKNPDLNSTFYVTYVTYEQIEIPPGTVISSYGRRAEETISYETIKPGVLKRTQQGRWEAEVSVRSSIPGVEGNIHAGALVVMPQPIQGVEYVINRRDILSGTNVEPDDSLRERARHALEVAGKATLVSLDSAIKGVEGVNTVLIEDQPEGVSGVVKVIVQGGDDEEIMRVIDETRAAGIRVEFSHPKIVSVDVSLTAVIQRGVDPATVSRAVESKIRSYISALDIGEDVVFNRIVNSSLSVENVYDVAEININSYRRGEDVLTSTGENVVISPTEIAMVREVSVGIRVHERGR